jgi:hypothetical protein
MPKPIGHRLSTSRTGRTRRSGRRERNWLSISWSVLGKIGAAPPSTAKSLKQRSRLHEVNLPLVNLVYAVIHQSTAQYRLDRLMVNVAATSVAV